jgi:hypothetical protein
MRRRIFVLAMAAGLAACGQSDGDNGAANTTANAATKAESPKRPSYCFFKDAATRGWTASPDAKGNLAVKGQVKVDDRRYRGDLTQSEVSGDTASVWLTMAPNNTGFSDDDNWWDVATTVPDSGAVTSVTVLCGKKEVAKLKVRRG